jgi:hypothetical protein
LDIVTTSLYLVFEWVRTFLIFSLMDRILVKRSFKQSLKTHDTYLLSLIVAAFLLIARARSLSFFSFVLWSFLVILSYLPIKLIFYKFLKN